VRTLGAFAKLPVVEVAERLGQEGVRFHKLACGMNSRPLVPYIEPLRFIEVMELDYEIVASEPLTFILSRMLDAICARLRSRNLATHELRVMLGGCSRVLNLPLPVRNSKILTRLLILDLEGHPPGVAVRRIEVEAIPAKPRVVQNGLFVPLSPEPEKLELTLARLKAVVGEENVGAAEISDTHRPDAFRMQKFEVLTGSTSSPNSPPNSQSPSPTPNRTPHSRSTSIALRRFRPPLDATVQLRAGLPIWIAFHGVHGPIVTTGGPWHTSGDWWRPTMWDREEWDIEVLDGLYRIYYDVHMDRWYAEGVYD
jgi:protein ImuB